MGQSCDAARRGITLLEVLVVLGIIAILVALLLPAVQYSREAARKVTCQSRLRQIAVAMHTHEGALRHLPTGGWGWRWHGEPDRGFDERQPGGWAYNVLAFLEQNDVRNLGLAEQHPQRASVLAQGAAMPLKMFVCPSRRSAEPQRFIHPVDYVNMARPTKVARSDYAACSGDQAPDVSLGKGRGPPSLAVGDSPGYLWLETDRSGVVFRRSRVSLGEILDGTSNTYMAGEKYVALEHHHSGKAENDDQHLLVGYDSDTLRTTDTAYPPLSDRLNVTSDHAFGSAHAGGFYMAMADGSVWSISFDVDRRVHRCLGNRHDGGVASAAELGP